MDVSLPGLELKILSAMQIFLQVSLEVPDGKPTDIQVGSGTFYLTQVHFGGKGGTQPTVCQSVRPICFITIELILQKALKGYKRSQSWLEMILIE